MSIESGRSVGEMLTVLAIMGVLSIVGIACYQVTINKSKANNIIHDGRIVHTLALSKSVENTDWQNESEFVSQSQKTFSFKKDIKKNTYIQVANVEKEVCKQLLTFKGNNLNLYTTDNTVFTTCQDTNNIVMDFDNNGIMSNCLTNSDCPESTPFCKQNQCTNCGEGRELNTAGTGCTCLEDSELSCSDEDGNEWCCSGNTICGKTMGTSQCEESTGKCSWNLTQETKSTCSWSLTQTAKATCTMELGPTDAQNNVPSVTIDDSKCATDEYCFVAYTNEGCSSTLGGSSTGTLYGSCSKMNTHNTSCGTLEMKETKSCPTGEYCFVAYTNEGCSSTLGGNSTGTLYGSCSKMNTHNTSCGTLEMKESQSCPAGKYCAIKYTSNTSCSTLGEDSTGTIYGACAVMDDNSPACPY